MTRILLITVYRLFAAPIGILLAVTIGQILIPKIREGLRLRRIKREWPEFTYPPVWIHASSGEFEYAKPVIREIKKRHPNQPIVVSYFSPSYERAVSRFPGVDFSCPLPLDLPGPTRAFLSKMKPQAGFIARTDLWPELLAQAKSLKIPVILFSMTKTKKPGVFIRQFDRWLYGYLKAIFCVGEADASIIRKIAPKTSCVAIGDTRFDQAIERLDNPRPLRENLKPDRSKTLVAGSTWQEDEKVLCPALEELLIAGELNLIIAPHEPTVAHVEDLIIHFMRRGIPVELYSKAVHFNSGVLVIDQIGILAELYQWCSIAFVGGSYKSTVHSVMEPLAAGALTIVGPRHQNNREAIDFQAPREEGPSYVQVARNSEELRKIVIQSFKTVNGDFATQLRDEIKNRAGASRRLVDFIERRERPVESPAEI